MAPPTPLSIATSSVKRLVKEEASYHREVEEQTKRIQRLEAEAKEAGGEDDDGNREYMLKQEVCLSIYLFLSFLLLLMAVFSLSLSLGTRVGRYVGEQSANGCELYIASRARGNQGCLPESEGEDLGCGCEVGGFVGEYPIFWYLLKICIDRLS